MASAASNGNHKVSQLGEGINERRHRRKSNAKALSERICAAAFGMQSALWLRVVLSESTAERTTFTKFFLIWASQIRVKAVLENPIADFFLQNIFFHFYRRNSSAPNSNGAEQATNQSLSWTLRPSKRHVKQAAS